MSRGVELPWHVFGRRIRPFSFGLMLGTVVIAVQFVLLPTAPGLLSVGWFSTQTFMAAICLIGAGLLFAGWVGKSDSLHDWGLLIVTGTWTGRAALYWMDGDREQVGLYLSFCWVIMAFGAWMIERYDHKWRHEVQARYDRRMGDA